MGLVISAPLPLRYNMVCVLYHLPEGRDNSCCRCWMVFELSTAVYSLRLPFLVDIHSGRLGSCKKKCWASISQIISTCLQSNLHLPSPVEGWGRVGGVGGGGEQGCLSNHSWTPGPHRLVGRKCQKPRRCGMTTQDHNRSPACTKQSVIVSLMWGQETGREDALKEVGAGLQNKKDLRGSEEWDQGLDPCGWMARIM